MTTISQPPPLIACLESYLCPSLPIGTSLADQSSPALHIIPPTKLSKLKNLGPARAKDMRSLGYAKQIVSHISMSASPTMSTKINDSLYAGLKVNMERMAALALLPVGQGRGREAAAELQRCVTKMKFVGGMIGLSRDRVGMLGGGDYDELWSAAEKFRVPIVLRDMWPNGSEVRSACI